MFIKDPEQIYNIIFSSDDRVAMRKTYDILLTIMNKFSSSDNIVSLESGETIGITELSRVLGILDGLMRQKYWKTLDDEEE